MSSGHGRLNTNSLRAETPGCTHRVHFNNAGAALMPQPVIDSVIDHLRLESKIGGYEAAEQRRGDLDQAYDAAARLIGADPNEIAFTENATRAFDLALFAIPFARGDRILVGAGEYISHQLAYQRVAAQSGVSIEAVPEDDAGRLSMNDFIDLLDDRVRLVALGHIGTNSGAVQPVAEVGAIVRDTDALFLVDACQSMGQLPVIVEKVGCHLLTATGRKYLRGPRGTGFLYVRESLLDLLEPPFPDVRGARLTAGGDVEFVPSAKRFETWESNYAARLGLSTAITYALEIGLEAIAGEIASITASLREALATLDHVTVLEGVHERSGLATFAVEGATPESVRAHLQSRRVNVSVSRLSDTPHRRAPWGHHDWVRASAHYFNNERDVDALVTAVAELR